MKKFLNLLLSISLLFAAEAYANACDPVSSAVPKNPFLADSSWPIGHANSYAQDSAMATAISSSTGIQTSKIWTVAPPINPVQSSCYADGSRAVWYSHIAGVGKIASAPGKFEIVDRIPAASLTSLRNEFSGAYGLIAANGTYYVPMGQVLYGFRDKAPGGPSASTSGIMVAGQIDLSGSDADSLPSDDSIVGLNMTYDGVLIAVSKQGRLLAVTRDFKKISLVQINPIQTVRNSIAIDENGGIYVVAENAPPEKNYMWRVQWTGSRLSINEADGAWNTTYEGQAHSGIKGETVYGSGSTPTVMGLASDPDQLVVITDGSVPMNIVAFWRNAIPLSCATQPCSRIAGSLRIELDQAQSEQSVVIAGYGAAVVNNQGNVITGLSKGMEKVVWSTTAHSWSKAWVNESYAFPNCIPGLSIGSNIIYGVARDSSGWLLVGLNWDNGVSAFTPYVYGSGPWNNSLYAGVSIGDGNAVFSGSATGVIKFFK